MKIESGNNVFILNFNESNKEEEVFLEVAKCMIEKKLDTKKVTEVVCNQPSTVTVSEPVVQLTHEPKTITPEKPYKDLACQPKQFYSTAREFLESQERKLVLGTCECEKDFHVWIDDPNQKEVKHKCKRCGEEKVIPVEDLVPATYTCEECGKKASFWMEANQSVAISCGKCFSEIDMYWHDKKKVMTNEI